MSSQFLLRRVELLERLMVPPETVQRGKITVVFIEPGQDGAPNTVVGTYEFLVDMPTAGGGR
jgi:hypothetical protein